ncbi:hypothetical protein ACDZ94_16595 [Pseudomonas sp. UBT]|uniref:hypothetical protein n=1 Tax=Pseudomonas sp. UBT TaxID=3239198 RepID=UPI003D807AF3
MIESILSSVRFANAQFRFMEHMKVSSPLLLANLISSTQAFVLLTIAIVSLSHQVLILTYAASLGLFYTALVLAVTNPIGYRISSHIAKGDHRSVCFTMLRAYPYLIVLIVMLWFVLIFFQRLAVAPILSRVDSDELAEYMIYYWVDCAILTLSVPLYLLVVALKKNVVILAITFFGVGVTVACASYQVLLQSAQIHNIAASALYGRVGMAVAYIFIFIVYVKDIWPHFSTESPDKSNFSGKELFTDVLDYVSASIVSNGLVLVQALVLSLTPTILIVNATVSSVSNVFSSLGLALGTSGGVALASAHARGANHSEDIAKAIKLYAKILGGFAFFCSFIVLVSQLNLLKVLDYVELCYLGFVTSALVGVAFFISYTSKAILRGDARFQKDLTFKFVRLRVLALIFFYVLTISDNLSGAIYFTLMLLMSSYYAVSVSRRINSGLWAEKFNRI